MAKSISEKIANILNVAPTNYGEDEVDENTSAALVDYDNENYEENFERSKLRALNDNFLENPDEKYAGKISSRKRLRDSDDESEENSQDFGESTEEEEGNSDNEEEDVLNDTEGSIEQSDSALESDNEIEFNHFSSSKGHDTVSKGYCVRNQLNIWENLLETRIQLQKCLSASNKLPIADNFKELCHNGDEEFKNKLSESKSCVTKILDKMLTLQDLVVKKFPETKKIFNANNQGKKSEESDEEIPSDDGNLSESEDENEEPILKKRKKNDYEQIISKRHELYKTFRNSTIQKWNDKVRIGLSKNNTNSQTILNQLDHIMSDKEKLIKKTQLKRSNYKIIGEAENEEEEVYNENIYDDDDFYHQLLRELIEFKSSDVTDPVQLGRQWIQLQNMRNKMKRKIDTRATKGRKIRYAVHTKLVNYMAPIDYRNTWSDEAKNELFGSLFGKK